MSPRKKPAQPGKPGRPRGRTRAQRTISIAPELWAWLDTLQLEGETRNDCMQRLVTKLKDCAEKTS